jgi:hypothetical protein
LIKSYEVTIFCVNKIKISMRLIEVIDSRKRGMRTTLIDPVA